MKRLFLLLILLALLVGLVFFLQNREKKYTDTFAGTEYTQFAVENAHENLGRIFIADRAGNQALYERQKDGSWLYTNKVTGKTYRPGDNSLNNMMEAIERIRVRNRVPNPSVKTVIRGLSAMSTKVELYDKKNKKIRTYYVGGPADASQGTFMIMEGSEIPYVVYIPNFVGTVDTRYPCIERQVRDKNVFVLDPKELEMVQIEYLSLDQRPLSFKILKKSAKDFEVTPIYGSNSVHQPNTQLNIDNIKSYLDGFDRLSAEMIIYDKSLRDSIITMAPFARISYKLRNQATPSSFMVYPVINPNYDRGDGQMGMRQKIMRYYVDIDEDNFFLMQDLVMNKLLLPYEYFFKNLGKK